MSVLFPFLSLPSKIPLNTSPKAPLPNKLEDKKHKKCLRQYLIHTQLF